MGNQGAEEARIPEALTSELRHFVANHGLSLNTLVEGSWALLLHRYSGQDDIIYGTTRSCRRASIAAADIMIGLLINTVPMRVRIEQKVKVMDWLKQLRDQHIQLREYLHSPLYKIQGWSNVPQGNPLFESLVVFENYSLSSYMQSKGGSWINREFEYRGRTNYPLTLIGYDAKEILLKIEYDQDRFRQNTLERMLGQLQTILRGFVEKSNKYVCEIPILTDEEREQILLKRNQA
jgi:non-ribosomal peptide synthetase component F